MCLSGQLHWYDPERCIVRAAAMSEASLAAFLYFREISGPS